MPNFPAYQLREFSGDAKPTTIVYPIGPGDTTITCQDASTWPAGSHAVFATIDEGQPNEERIAYQPRSGSVLNNVIRGIDGTTPSAHASGAPIAHTYSAQDASEANELVAEVHGWKAWTPAITVLVGGSLGTNQLTFARYRTVGDACEFEYSALISLVGGGTTTNGITVSLPVAPRNSNVIGSADCSNNLARCIVADGVLKLYPIFGFTWPLDSIARGFSAAGRYEIA